MSFLVRKDDHFLLYVKANPNSGKTKIGGIICDEKNQKYLKINIAAIPEKGKANEEILLFLAKLLKIPKSKISLMRGATNRIKVIKISRDMDETFLRSQLC